MRLFNLNGRISIGSEFRNIEGNLDVIWKKSNDISLTIRMKFETTNKLNEAYEYSVFIEDLLNLIRTYYNLKELSTDQTRLNSFIKPNIVGVKNDLLQLETPIDVSYQLENNLIKLIDVSNTSLLEYFYKNQDENQDIFLEVKINEIFINIHWDSDKEFWYIDNKDLGKIPSRGKIRIGENKKNEIDKDKIHNKKKLKRMLSCLQDLKENQSSPGKRTLSLILASDFDEINNSNAKISNLNENLRNNGLNAKYNRLNQIQKQCINDINNKLIILINGRGRTGKTEVISLLGIFSALSGEKILTTSEKNNAVDNILARIDQILQESHLTNIPLNIVRIRAHDHQLEKKELKKYELEETIKRISDEINKKCSIKRSNESETQLYSKFKEIFTKTDVLNNLITLTYDIILTTYGVLSERRYLIDNIQEYDLNIVDAGSSINFSSFSIGACNSKKWVICNDDAQISPKTTGDFLLNQPLIIPTKDEIQNAKMYDPNQIKFKRAKVHYGNKEYRSNIASFFVNIENNPYLSAYLLKEQFRTFPNLNKIICRVFDEKYNCNLDPSTFLDLSNVSSLLSSKNHLKYQIMKEHEILSEMGNQIAELVDNLSDKILNVKKKLSIGISCTDIFSLRKIVTCYKKKRNTKLNSFSKIRKSYNDEYMNIKITFSSIENHQEREYDIFILGILNYNSPQFKKRLYTALTRACNYVIIFGPQVKGLSKNMKLLHQLQEEGE